MRPGWAETVARALGGRKVGSGWMAPCPAHDDRNPSLSLRDGADGTLLIYCFAGCDQRAVIAALADRGLWPNDSDRSERRVDRHVDAAQKEDEADDRRVVALSLWNRARSATGTAAATYFRSRGITVEPPAALRFSPDLKHGSDGRWPAIVALVTRGSDGMPLGVHRTYLARDGTAKAPVVPAKMALGPIRGGAVRLANAGPVLLVGEGIETVLSVMQETRLPGWAALSTSGLLALELPPEVETVIVLADADEPGLMAAEACARRWRHEGRLVAAVCASTYGLDFSDLLQRLRRGPGEAS